MTVKNLKEMLADVPDDAIVLIPMSGEFDGFWNQPCTKSSGISQLTEDENGEESPLDAFILVPCGFFDEPTEPDPELN